MATKKEVDQLLVTMMSEKLDVFMGDQGFSRRKNSKKYVRNIFDTKQELEMTYFLNPKYGDQAMAHINPMITITIPEINDIVVEMTEERGLVSSPTITLKQSMENVAPNEYHQRWLPKSEEDFLRIGDNILGFLEKWVVCFFNDYTNPQGVVDCYERNDNRPVKTERWIIYVVACYIALGQIETAHRVLHEEFPRPGAKRRYSTAFDYVSNLMN